jgi:hypothetical protein
MQYAYALQGKNNQLQYSSSGEAVKIAGTSTSQAGILSLSPTASKGNRKYDHSKIDTTIKPVFTFFVHDKKITAHLDKPSYGDIKSHLTKSPGGTVNLTKDGSVHPRCRRSTSSCLVSL